jgi:hypothetical protein
MSLCKISKSLPSQEYFLVVTDHMIFVYLLKQSSDKLIDRQTNLGFRVYGLRLGRGINALCEFYAYPLHERNLKRGYPMFRGSDFLPIDNMYRLYEGLWWDGKVPNIKNDNSNPTLLAVSTF